MEYLRSWIVPLLERSQAKFDRAQQESSSAECTGEFVFSNDLSNARITLNFPFAENVQIVQLRSTNGDIKAIITDAQNSTRAVITRQAIEELRDYTITAGDIQRHKGTVIRIVDLEIRVSNCFDPPRTELYVHSFQLVGTNLPLYWYSNALLEDGSQSTFDPRLVGFFGARNDEMAANRSSQTLESSLPYISLGRNDGNSDTENQLDFASQAAFATQIPVGAELKLSRKRPRSPGLREHSDSYDIQHEAETRNGSQHLQTNIKQIDTPPGGQGGTIQKSRLRAMLEKERASSRPARSSGFSTVHLQEQTQSFAPRSTHAEAGFCFNKGPGLSLTTNRITPGASPERKRSSRSVTSPDVGASKRIRTHDPDRALPSVDENREMLIKDIKEPEMQRKTKHLNSMLRNETIESCYRALKLANGNRDEAERSLKDKEAREDSSESDPEDLEANKAAQNEELAVVSTGLSENAAAGQAGTDQVSSTGIKTELWPGCDKPQSQGVPRSSPAADREAPLASILRFQRWRAEAVKGRYLPRYAAKIAKAEMDLLKAGHSWQPPLIGHSARPGTVPLDLLNMLTKDADDQREREEAVAAAMALNSFGDGSSRENNDGKHSEEHPKFINGSERPNVSDNCPSLNLEVQWSSSPPQPGDRRLLAATLDEYLEPCSSQSYVSEESPPQRKRQLPPDSSPRAHTTELSERDQSLPHSPGSDVYLNSSPPVHIAEPARVEHNSEIVHEFHNYARQNFSGHKGNKVDPTMEAPKCHLLEPAQDHSEQSESHVELEPDHGELALDSLNQDYFQTSDLQDMAVIMNAPAEIDSSLSVIQTISKEAENVTQSSSISSVDSTAHTLQKLIQVKRTPYPLYLCKQSPAALRQDQSEADLTQSSPSFVPGTFNRQQMPLPQNDDCHTKRELTPPTSKTSAADVVFELDSSEDNLDDDDRHGPNDRRIEEESMDELNHSHDHCLSGVPRSPPAKDPVPICDKCDKDDEAIEESRPSNHFQTSGHDESITHTASKEDSAISGRKRENEAAVDGASSKQPKTLPSLESGRRHDPAYYRLQQTIKSQKNVFYRSLGFEGPSRELRSATSVQGSDHGQKNSACYRPEDIYGSDHSSSCLHDQMVSTPITSLSSHRRTPQGDKHSSLARSVSSSSQLAQSVRATHAAFKSTYPMYGGDLVQFETACQLLSTLRQDGKAPHPCLWDDFIIRLRHEYQEYVQGVLHVSGSVLPFEKYYEEYVESPRILNRIVRLDFIDSFSSRVANPRIQGIDLAKPRSDIGWSIDADRFISNKRPEATSDRRISRQTEVVNNEEVIPPEYADLPQQNPVSLWLEKAAGAESPVLGTPDIVKELKAIPLIDLDDLPSAPGAPSPEPRLPSTTREAPAFQPAVPPSNTGAPPPSIETATSRRNTEPTDHKEPVSRLKPHASGRPTLVPKGQIPAHVRAAPTLTPETSSIRPNVKVLSPPETALAEKRKPLRLEGIDKPPTAYQNFVRNYSNLPRERKSSKCLAETDVQTFIDIFTWRH